MAAATTREQATVPGGEKAGGTRRERRPAGQRPQVWRRASADGDGGGAGAAGIGLAGGASHHSAAAAAGLGLDGVRSCHRGSAPGPGPSTP